MIRRLLIANRGEIAVRIIRTCRQMDIETVAVYSTADREALHVQLADRSVCIGGPRSADSYLNIGNILSAACLTGCDAVHPGFGFLSENATFARTVRECGLIFVGPSPELIEAMGDKATAKKKMQEAGIPVVPGSDGVTEDWEDGLREARAAGFPVMIKASAGGGGKGMRLCRNEDDFHQSFDSASSEALAAFGDGRVYIEKFIERPKHIEVQLAADHFGNVIHLYERDCSLQRRNQKMLEESPAHCLTGAQREKICSDAVKAAKSVGYDSVGTIEFLLDSDGSYYFMEMNTRIQVEHTISEAVTGLDLVRLQILAAQNQPLGISQEDVSLKGCAVECRINAEDPDNNFAPSPGKISFVNLPGGRGVRIDTAVYPGAEIPPYYDAMILKLICFDRTRLGAIRNMRTALEELVVSWIKTNTGFQYLLLHQPQVLTGKYDTHMIEDFVELLDKRRKEQEESA